MLCTIYPVLASLCVSLCWNPAAAAPVVAVQEVVTRYELANNGAGPLWCFGSTVIVSSPNDVYLSTIETGKDVPPLCNTRWQLWHRTDYTGWKLVQSEKEFRQREPCPIALLAGGNVVMSANPSTQPPGTKYGPCHPQVLQFGSKRPDTEPTVMEPAWDDKPAFTDHSYRGFAADGPRRELLLLNIHSKTGDQYVSFYDDQRQWHARGKIHFPIRAAYPQVALRNRAAHVMAIGDIVEPKEEWRKLKFEKLKSEWDYVFRRLFYAWTPDVANQPFGEPIEVDSVEATGGHISNHDLYIDPAGAAHLLYLKQPHQYAFIRTKYFPGEAMTSHLIHMVLKDGKVVARQTLAETPLQSDGMEPGWARFHVTAKGDLYVVLAGTPTKGGKAEQFGNFLGRIETTNKAPDWFRLDLKHPFHSFLTNTTRGGSEPSDLLDMFGTADDAPNLRYARVQVVSRDTEHVFKPAKPASRPRQ